MNKALKLLRHCNELNYKIFENIYSNIIITKFILKILLKKKDKLCIWTTVSILLNQINEDFSNNREIIEIAINKIGSNYLEFASTELRDDREIVKIAISKCGHSLQFASMKLQAER